MGNYSRSGGAVRPPKKEKKSGDGKKERKRMTYDEGREELSKLLKKYEEEK